SRLRYLFFIAPIFFVLRATFLFPEGTDFRTFHHGGRQFLEGANPYLEPKSQRTGYLVNPPTALPLYAAVGALPLDVALIAWTAFNVAGCLALAPMAREVLSARGEGRRSMIGSGDVLALAAVVCLSNAANQSLEQGQLSIWTAVLIYSALIAQGKGRPAV